MKKLLIIILCKFISCNPSPAQDSLYNFRTHPFLKFSKVGESTIIPMHQCTKEWAYMIGYMGNDTVIVTWKWDGRIMVERLNK